MTNALALPIAHGLLPVVLLANEPVPNARADTGQMLVWLVVAAAVIGVVSVAMTLANHIARRRRLSSHPGLFAGLCRLHGLDSASRRLLKRVARQHRLTEPGRLFVEPKWLDPANLDASFRAHVSLLETLRKALFSVRSRPGESA